jgi:NhaP-type Na+/H+ or K+/H+ antiporter
MSAATHFIVGLEWKLSLLFGALVSVTGPTVIVPMLRSIQPTARIANILRWEGILVDPIGAVLAVLIFEMLITGQQSESWLEFVKVIALGTVWGVSGGVTLGQMLKRHIFPDYLQNYAALAFVLVVFTASNSLGQESGLIAVTAMGLVMANMKGLDIGELLSFKEHLTVVRFPCCSSCWRPGSTRNRCWWSGFRRCWCWQPRSWLPARFRWRFPALAQV